MISNNGQAKNVERLKIMKQSGTMRQSRNMQWTKTRMLFALIYNSFMDIAIISIGIICISNIMMYSESGVCSIESANSHNINMDSNKNTKSKIPIIKDGDVEKEI